MIIHPRRHDVICKYLGVPRGANLQLSDLAQAFTAPGQHRHRCRVEGCFRCDLTAAETPPGVGVLMPGLERVKP